MLSNMDNAQGDASSVCADIDRLESEADHVMRSAMAKLFRDEPDVKQIIKLRSVYELLEIDHRPLRGRGERHRGHRPRERLSGAAASTDDARDRGLSRSWSRSRSTSSTASTTPRTRSRRSSRPACCGRTTRSSGRRSSTSSRSWSSSQRRGDDRHGIIDPAIVDSPRRVRRARRRDRVERHHVVLRHSRRARRMRSSAASRARRWPRAGVGTLVASGLLKTASRSSSSPAARLAARRRC